MRLPWPFGRGTTSGDAAPAEVAGAAASPTATPPVQRDAPPTGAWTTLPPIQRTVSAAPLVAPTAPFLDDVPGHRPLPPIVQPLGHEQASSAPAGLVVAHAAPTPTLTSSAAMPTRHVQRRAAGTPEPVWTGADTVDDVTAAPSAVRSPDPEPEPVRRVAPVAPSQAVTPPARPLTEAPPIASGRAAAVQRDAATPSTPARVATSAPATAEPSLPLASRGAAPARAGSRWSEGPATTRPGLAAPIAALPATAAPPSAPVQRSTTSERGPEPTPEPPRRAGLGAPIAAVPPTAVQRSGPAELPLVQRIAAAHAASADVAAPASPPVAMASSDHEGPAHAGADHAATPSPARRLPVLPVARHGDAPTAPVQRSASTPSATTQRPAPTADRSARPAVLPLVGARPLRPSVAIQRDGDTASAPADATSRPVAARWTMPGDLPATVQGTMSTPAADAVPLQRLAASEPATTPASSGPVEWTAAGGWRGAHSPSLGSPAAGQSAQRQPGLGAPSGARPANPAPPSLQLARSAPPPAPAPAPAAPAPTPVVSRIVAGSPTPSATPTVQTLAAPGAGLPSLTVTPVVQRVEGTAPQPQGGQSGHSDKELDELAKQLFGRFRGQLRAEVITEREARGLGFDAF